MKVILDDGTEFAAKFAHAPTLSGDCAIEIRSAGGKRVSEIAKMFDRQKKIIKRDENEGDAEYVGYTMLYLIRENADKSVTMFFRKEETV